MGCEKGTENLSENEVCWMSCVVASYKCGFVFTTMIASFFRKPWVGGIHSSREYVILAITRLHSENDVLYTEGCKLRHDPDLSRIPSNIWQLYCSICAIFLPCSMMKQCETYQAKVLLFLSLDEISNLEIVWSSIDHQFLTNLDPYCI